MWDLPRPEIKLVSPALAGGFFTTEPVGKPPFLVIEHFIWFHLPSLRMSIIYFTGCPRVCSLQCTSTTNTTLLSNNAVLLHDFQFVQLLSCGSDDFQSLYMSQTRNLKYGYYFYLFSCLFIQQIFGCLLDTRHCSRYWRYSSKKEK